MYFEFYKLQSWGKRSASRRRRFIQRFLKPPVVRCTTTPPGVPSYGMIALLGNGTHRVPGGLRAARPTEAGFHFCLRFNRNRAARPADVVSRTNSSTSVGICAPKGAR